MGSSFNDVSAVIAIGVVVSLVLRLIRQPLTIGYILTGVLVGPALLNIIDSPDSIGVFADFGIALLLFIIGLGLNPRIVNEVGKIAAYIALGKILSVTAIVYILAQLFGYDTTSAFYLGIALSFSSTIIILKLLTDRKEHGRLYGKISIGFLLIEDVVATAVLIGVSAGIAENGTSFQAVSTLLLRISALAIGILLFRNFILYRFNNLIGKSQELLFLFAIGWGLGLATAFKAVGFSMEVGALLAGVMLTPLPYAQEAAARLKPLRDFFIVLFFVSVGSYLHIENVSQVLPEALFFSSLILFGNPVMVTLIASLSGYTRRTSFRTAMTGGQISEFSLIIILLVYGAGKVDDSLVTLVTMIMLITTAASTYLITYSEGLYGIFEDVLRVFERRQSKSEIEKTANHDLILFGYLKGGHEFVRLFEQLNRPFLVVDYDPGIIETLESKGIHHVYGDISDSELLEELNLGTAKLVVSTVTDREVNARLINHLSSISSPAVFVCTADTIQTASELYALGAAYVILPQHVGNEKIGAFIKRSGLKKSEFKKYREKHLAYLKSHYDLSEPETSAA